MSEYGVQLLRNILENIERREKVQAVRGFIDKHGRKVKGYTRKRPWHYDNPTTPMKIMRLKLAEAAYQTYGLKGLSAEGVPLATEKVGELLRGMKIEKPKVIEVSSASRELPLTAVIEALKLLFSK